MRRTRSETKPHSNPTDSSKISFRARKIRRITPNTKDSESQPEPEPSTTPSPTSAITKPLTTTGEIQAALNHLRAADPLLSNCIDSLPPPHFSTDAVSPFLSLTKSIISQQLSNKAAAAIESRFISLCGGRDSVLPDVVLALSPSQLRQAGISGPKATYLHDLAAKYIDGTLSDSSILQMDDETLHEKLTLVKGIGPWSVHMFMIFTLHRPDVLPVGDLVVRRGVERLYGLKALPNPSQMERLCQKWKPYSTVGSCYMYRFMEAKWVLPLPLPLPTPNIIDNQQIG